MVRENVLRKVLLACQVQLDLVGTTRIALAGECAVMPCDERPDLRVP